MHKVDCDNREKTRKDHDKVHNCVQDTSKLTTLKQKENAIKKN